MSDLLDKGELIRHLLSHSVGQELLVLDNGATELSRSVEIGTYIPKLRARSGRNWNIAIQGKKKGKTFAARSLMVQVPAVGDVAESWKAAFGISPAETMRRLDTSPDAQRYEFKDGASQFRLKKIEAVDDPAIDRLLLLLSDLSGSQRQTVAAVATTDKAERDTLHSAASTHTSSASRSTEGSMPKRRPTYLLTWNPARTEWERGQALKAIQSGKHHTTRWSCGNTKSIPRGARAFLLQQGVEPRGVVASGIIRTDPHLVEHWDDDKARSGATALYVQFEIDAMIDASTALPLDVRQFRSGSLSEIKWSTQASGIRIADDAAAELELAWAAHLGISAIESGEDDAELSAFENRLRAAFVTHRSRERSFRKAKLEQARRAAADRRLRCEVPGCGFDFLERYGEGGGSSAHVHHLKPLSSTTEVVETKLSDLAVVCANCHSIIHAGGRCLPMKDVIPEKK